MTENIGLWEKHTKGIGKKLLEKFGFKGRLGANEDGISTAIEVEIRPVGLGIGYGNSNEKRKRESNSSLQYEEFSEKLESQKSKIIKTRKRRRLEIFEFTSDKQETDSDINLNIVDLSDPKQFSYQLGKELLFNLDSLEYHLFQELSKIRGIYFSGISNIREHINSISQILSVDNEQRKELSHLSTLSSHLSNVGKHLHDMNESCATEVVLRFYSMVWLEFKHILRNFPAQFASYGLIKLLYSINDFVPTDYLIETLPSIVTKWGEIILAIKGGGLTFLLEEVDSNIEAWINDHFKLLTESYDFCKDEKMSINACTVFSRLEDLSLHSVSQRFLSDLVIPRLNAVIDSHRFGFDGTESLSRIVYPWTLFQNEALNESISRLYKNLSKYASSSNITYDDHEIFAKVGKLFKKNTFDKFVSHHLIPKLVYSIRHQINDVVLSIEKLMFWSDVLDKCHLISLLAETLLVSIKQILQLLKEECTQDTIRSYYVECYKAIPAIYLTDETIIKYFGLLMKVVEDHLSNKFTSKDLEEVLDYLDTHQEFQFDSIYLQSKK